MNQSDNKEAMGGSIERRDVLKAVAGAALGAGVLQSTAQAAPAPAGDAYKRVATVIGDAMDAAWKDIMTKLASGAAPGGVGAVDVTGFMSVLGAANLDIHFAPSSLGVPTGTYGRFHLIPIAAAVGKGPGGGVDVSIGVGIHF
jgi:hypothetical protein